MKELLKKPIVIIAAVVVIGAIVIAIVLSSPKPYTTEDWRKDTEEGMRQLQEDINNSEGLPGF